MCVCEESFCVIDGENGINCVNSELLWGEKLGTCEIQRTRELLAIESVEKACINDCELAILDWEDENELFKLDWDDEVEQEG